MKIIERKDFSNRFPLQVECEQCQSVLLLESYEYEDKVTKNVLNSEKDAVITLPKRNEEIRILFTCPCCQRRNFNRISNYFKEA